MVTAIYGFNPNDVRGAYKDVLDGLRDNIPSSIDRHLYFIESSEVIDFNTNNPHSIQKTLEAYLPEYDVRSFEVNDYSEYDRYFYKTDHHWNHLGSYKGYEEIMEMLPAAGSLLKPTDEIDFGVDFYGSYARSDAYYDIHQSFTAYIFDYPPHDVYVNGEKSSYGNQQAFVNGTFARNDININYYGVYYGGDVAELVFDYKNAEAENILIIGNSLDNAVVPLIASHFNKSYCLDLRHYKNLKIEEYIEKNNITQFLFIGYINSITDPAFAIRGRGI
jgi:hypothetical protein